jgi:hypothetical protein
VATSHGRTDLSQPPATRVSSGLNPTETTMSVGFVGGESTKSHGCTVLSLLPLARRLG